MANWTPATREEVDTLFSEAVGTLHPAHRRRLAEIRVPFRAVPVASNPGESVFVVAEYDGKIVYHSDVENGWEVESPNPSGGIGERGANQYELSHLMWQLFGDPEQLE